MLVFISEEVDVFEKNLLLIMLKNIMNWCKIRKNFVLFSLKDYVMLNLLISYDNEIYDF